MKRIIAGGIPFTLVLALCIPGAFAQSAQRQADCSTYARNQSEAQRTSGGGALGNTAHGAIGGAAFGAIVGGGKGARKGAALGGGIGLIRGSARGSREREANYQYYYNQCMQGRQ